MLHSNLGINKEGHLTFAGFDTVSLAEKYSTPLMLLDEERIRNNLRMYISEMADAFGDGSFPCFASKALSFTDIYRIVKDEGAGIDIVSPGELYIASRAGFPLEKAFFHGNNKTDSDISYALDKKIGYFVVDNEEELLEINRQCEERGICQNILIRLSPGVDPHTHEKITTGQVDSKFGIAIETGQAIEFVGMALSLKNVNLMGYHCHVGSQSFDSRCFIDAAAIMLSFIRDVLDRYGVETKILNLGGGFGIRYVEEDPHIDIPFNIRMLSENIKAICANLKILMPKIIMEPGRSIVADAGLTLYTCGSVKTITGYKSYISIDGGMADNPRYALYSSAYTVLNATKADKPKDLVATIAGRCCESGDLIQEGVSIARPERGDKIAVLVTGAYNYSMASNYNRIPRPPIVSLYKGEDRVVVKRETFEDLVKNDL
jgi:diaminopimelate decarboxylase